MYIGRILDLLEDGKHFSITKAKKIKKIRIIAKRQALQDSGVTYRTLSEHLGPYLVLILRKSADYDNKGRKAENIRLHILPRN